MARGNKSTARATSNAVRVLHSTLIVAGYALVSGYAAWGLLARPLWPHSYAVAFVGLTLTWAGILFAIWARLTLGANWSAKPSVKHGHELVIRGPYALARHPIYTGLLVAAAGTATAVDTWGAMLGILLVATAFAIKIRVEERLMLESFPDEYPAYRQQVKAILPGIL